ncbi:nucleotidyltransferase [Tenacibaculum maritimum]|uniref:nucleotidyltransferase n=1 Tax=Tenacibaculum maritimum TaxID=107401 RepID=UPI0012E542BC|nr:nucleotidyltransferase [Tenacibaculum maritimum]CAA0158110.1 conserved hypothetical protein [Tenacibaculum maritimum]CAA0222209.1 conserved hypothetical protein [Tenacibaculum maritimum]
MGTVQQTKDKMIAVKEQTSHLDVLTNTRETSIWGNFIYIVSVCIEDLKKYFDTHRSYIDYKFANQIAGTLAWYRQKALDYQWGFDLLNKSDKFNISNATDKEIEDSKIVKYATANDGKVNGSVVIKVATEKNGKLSTVSKEQEKALEAYFEEIKFAGDEVVIINHLADKLYLNIRIYRDPLVLTSDGISILKGNKPIEEALQQFMKELPFNGELVLQNLTDKLQVIEGVKIAHLVEIKSSSLDPKKDEHGIPQLIEVSQIPASGYFEIVNFDNITYVV